MSATDYLINSILVRLRGSQLPAVKSQSPASPARVPAGVWVPERSNRS
jgi:hypothetical protein